jgi:uncharacterized membrane protein
MAGTQTSPNTSNLNCTQMLKGWASEGWWPELVASATLHTCGQPQAGSTQHCTWYNNTHALARMAGTQTSPNTSNLNCTQMPKGWASEGWWPELVASATLHTVWPAPGWIPQHCTGTTALMHWPEWLAHIPTPTPPTSNCTQMLKGWCSEGWWPELVASATLHTVGQPQAGSHNNALVQQHSCTAQRMAGTQTSPNTSNLNCTQMPKGWG